MALFLEAGLAYELVPVGTRKGERHLPAFTAIEALKAKYACKTDMDDDAKKAMLPQNARLASKEA